MSNSPMKSKALLISGTCISAMAVALIVTIMPAKKSEHNDAITMDAESYQSKPLPTASSSEHTDVSKDTDKQLAQLITQLNLLNQRMTGMERKISELSLSQSSTPVTEDTAQSEADSSVQDNYLDEFNHVFFSEDIDPGWSDTAEDSLRNALVTVQDVMPQMIVHEVACLSTLCRASYQLPDENGLQQNIHKIGNALNWESKSFIEYKVDDQGKVLVESFYMRENHDYPEFVGGAH